MIYTEVTQERIRPKESTKTDFSMTIGQNLARERDKGQTREHTSQKYV